MPIYLFLVEPSSPFFATSRVGYLTDGYYKEFPVFFRFLLRVGSRRLMLFFTGLCFVVLLGTVSALPFGKYGIDSVETRCHEMIRPFGQR